jgi:hypothetical protein
MNSTIRNLEEELEGRQMAIQHINMVGGPASYKNFHLREMAGIKKQLAPLYRAQAAAKNRVRINRKVQAHVKRAANAFMSPLYKPRTSTSPAGMRAAAALNAHMPSVSYANAQAAMREMMRARRKRSPS